VPIRCVIRSSWPCRQNRPGRNRRRRDELAAIVDAPVTVMAYPNGRPRQDYAREHVEMVRKADFGGCHDRGRGARVGDDLLQLPRFSPWDRALWNWSARLWLNQWRAGTLVA
jgi:hypothetical protein